MNPFKSKLRKRIEAKIIDLVRQEAVLASIRLGIIQKNNIAQTIAIDVLIQQNKGKQKLLKSLL